MRPIITITGATVTSSWGERDGLWCDEKGVPQPRSYWHDRYVVHQRGRQSTIRPDQYDEAHSLRRLYHSGAVTAAAVAECLGIGRRAANRFLAYEVLWWL